MRSSTALDGDVRLSKAIPEATAQARPAGSGGRHAWGRQLAAACTLGLFASTAALADADSARTKGAAWLVKQQRGDGSWVNASGDLGVQATASAVLALKNAGLNKSPSFGAGATWLSNADADSVDSISRKIEALSAAGYAGTAQAESNRLFDMRASTTAAMFSGYGSFYNVDLVDSALGLRALRLGDAGFAFKAYAASNNTVVGAICALVTYRQPVATGKQAWALVPTSINQTAARGRPSVVATSLVIGELRALQKFSAISNVNCSGTAYTLADLQAQAVAWLLDQQNSDGGFGEQRTDGSKGISNVLTTVWAYRALNEQASVSQPQTGNALNWLLSKQNASTGSWDADPLATASVVAALPAAAGAQLTDTDRDGLTDTVEGQLGSSTTVADSRAHLGDPTLSVGGVTATAFTAKGQVGASFSYSLGSGSTYQLAGGSLPPGLQVNAATGLISGTPTQEGAYSFEYQVGSAGDIVVGRIDVAPPVETGDVPLPGWALVGLGASFVAAMRRRFAA